TRSQKEAAAVVRRHLVAHYDKVYEKGKKDFDDPGFGGDCAAPGGFCHAVALELACADVVQWSCDQLLAGRRPLHSGQAPVWWLPRSPWRTARMEEKILRQAFVDVP